MDGLCRSRGAMGPFWVVPIIRDAARRGGLTDDTVGGSRKALGLSPVAPLEDRANPGRANGGERARYGQVDSSDDGPETAFGEITMPPASPSWPFPDGTWREFGHPIPRNGRFSATWLYEAVGKR